MKLKMNKRGFVFMVVIAGVFVIVLGIVLAYSFWQEIVEEPSFCEKEFSKLSCEQLKKCYDECNKEIIILWSIDCRDRIKPFLWKCYNEN